MLVAGANRYTSHRRKNGPVHVRHIVVIVILRHDLVSPVNIQKKSSTLLQHQRDLLFLTRQGDSRGLRGPEQQV